MSVHNITRPEQDTAEAATRPPGWLLAAEVPRAIAEAGWLAVSRWQLARSPQGDGHPVIVLPGFMVGDRSTGPMRRYLRGRGYHTHGWGLGTNAGPTQRILDGLEARFDSVYKQHGRPCTVIGWSLGGMFARAIARDNPKQVRQVITMGTPFRMSRLDQLGAGRLYASMSDRHAPAVQTIDEIKAAPRLQVPSTAIYSRSDGFAPWQICQDGQGPTWESIEVLSSHSGLGHNPVVLAILADRLAQPEGAWAPLDRTALPTALRWPRHTPSVSSTSGTSA